MNKNSQPYSNKIKMEKIPKIPMRKEAPSHICFENGRRLGLFQAEQIVKSHIENTYPINCKSIIEELNATIKKLQDKNGK